MSPPVFPDDPAVLAATGQASDRSFEQAADLEYDFSERLLRTFLGLCEGPRTSAGMLRLVRGAVASPGAGRAFYRVLNRSVVTPVARATGIHTSAMRIELVCGQLVGLAMMRYVLDLEPVASASTEEIVRTFAPAIRATLRSSAAPR